MKKIIFLLLISFILSSKRLPNIKGIINPNIKNNIKRSLKHSINKSENQRISQVNEKEEEKLPKKNNKEKPEKDNDEENETKKLKKRGFIKDFNRHYPKSTNNKIKRRNSIVLNKEDNNINTKTSPKTRNFYRLKFVNKIKRQERAKFLRERKEMIKIKQNMQKPFIRNNRNHQWRSHFTNRNN